MPLPADPISKEEWQVWKQHRVTRQLIANLVSERQNLLEEWAEGRCPDDREAHKQEGRAQKLKDIILHIIDSFPVVEPIQKEPDSGN